jgi:CheY-like chemotaxis protein/nitrogen-specific signal transduction histidine kinase
VVERTADLNRVKVDLERASRAKDEFLANMSHELRTPLNSILGLSELLLEQIRGPLNEYQQKTLRIIESSGQHLLALINDVLDISKIEAGQLQLHPETVEVSRVCEASLAFVREQAVKKSILLEFRPDAAGNTIAADPRYLKQILVNLLTNAVKFTPANGQVALEVITDAEQGLMQFRVRDTGIGITPENLSQLFRPFVQVESSLNRQYEGTGLGLALVQRLADLHGGSVQVESAVGKGSCFTINLPWQPNMSSSQMFVEEATELSANRQMGITDAVSSMPAPRGRILLVEDNPANVLTIGEYLEHKNFSVVVAHNGLEALVQAEASNPNIILMDIQMPVMDGLEATRRLRANPRFRSVPIVALTALAMPGDREHCLQAGANEYVSKPVSLKQLVKIIDSLTGQGE